MEIRPIVHLPESFSALLSESLSQGFNFLEKMRLDWATNANRFDKLGESVFGVFENDRLIAIGGINVDPYSKTPGVGRIRHLYVLNQFRKSGVGKLLVERLLADGRQYFLRIRLRTDTEAAAKFYEAIGFKAVKEDSASHSINVEQ